MGIHPKEIPSLDYMSLFCGSLAVSGALALFAVKDIKWKYKAFAFLLIVFSFLMFHWKILFFMFSLMKKPMGFMPRYSYLGSFILIFLSGCYFSDWKKWGFGIRQLIICLLFPVSQILIERLRPALYQNFFLFNIAFLVIVPCILYEIDRSYRINVKKNFMMGLLACMLIWEMSMSACIFLSMRGAGSLYTYQSYDDQQRTQIQEIKAYDGGIYRINQVMNRGDIRAKDEQEKNKGFNLNESMNFNYWGIQEYTSLLKKSQFKLSSNIGYYDFTERANRFYECLNNLV